MKLHARRISKRYRLRKTGTLNTRFLKALDNITITASAAGYAETMRKAHE